MPGDALQAERGDRAARGGQRLGQLALRQAEVNPTTVRRIIRGAVRAQPKTVVSFARALGIGALRMRQMMDARYSPGPAT